MVELVKALDDEFERLTHDAAERAQEAGRGAALIGTAGAFGLIAVAAFGSLPLLALRRIMPAWQIGLIVGTGSAATATVLARMGLSRMAAVAPEALEQEVEDSAKEALTAVE
jgi:hypothetical protein